jgi:hypothetical protein
MKKTEQPQGAFLGTLGVIGTLRPKTSDKSDEQGQRTGKRDSWICLLTPQPHRCILEL